MKARKDQTASRKIVQLNIITVADSATKVTMGGQGPIPEVGGAKYG